MSSNFATTSENQFKEFDELTSLLSDYIKIMDDDSIGDLLETGADEFLNDLKKLPKPYSRISKAGYTHLVHTFSKRRQKNRIEVGWGKYYGRMVEEGTRKMRAQPHFKPTFERNKEKYYKKMVDKIHSNR